MRSQQSPDAFSLVELVIALAILSIGLVGAMRVFPVGLRASERAEVDSRAAMAGQRAIESLKLLSWDELAIAETTSEDDDFTITTSITEMDLDDLVDTNRLKAIEVIVQSTRGGRTRELELVTYVRRDAS